MRHTVLTFQNTTEDEDVVEDGEEDEDPVEDAVQLLGHEHRDGHAVAYDAGQPDDYMSHAVKRVGQLVVELHLLLGGAVAWVVVLLLGLCHRGAADIVTSC